jgi:MFS superfamily sulfate permease-like transporter
MSAVTTERVGDFHVGAGEASGAVADLGVLVPLAAALVLVNGLDAGAVFLCAGLLYLGAGLWFRVPFPVQPLKALAAIAVAEGLHPGVINAAGLEMGLLLLLISIGGLANVVARIFTKTVIRSLQLGVGILLGIAAWKLVTHPPEVFSGVPSSPWPILLGAATLVAVWWAARDGRYWAALAILVAGIAGTVVSAHPSLDGPSFHVPSIGIPPAAAFGTALWMLVIPQLPLTFGNAVVAVNELAHEYFGTAARRVSPSRICISDGFGNVIAGFLGGMPMCHGAGGLTAHVKLGARTAGMNLVLGVTLVATGLFFGAQVPVLLGLLPVWALAGFLAYAGIRHASLVSDLRGPSMAIALTCGVLGAAMGNLAITAGVALLADHGLRLRTARARSVRARA